MSKSKILVATTFLLLCTLMPLANASPALSRFYVKAYIPPESFVGTIHVSENTMILQGTQEGWITDKLGNRLGTITIFSNLVIKLGDNGLYDATAQGTGRFVITFDNGTVIEGVGHSTMVHPTIGTNQLVEGTFVANGDMHVKGIMENIEAGSGFALNGYSW